MTVLRDGAYAGTLSHDELSADRIVKLMVGRDLSSFYTMEHDPDAPRGAPVLEVRDLTDGGRRVRPVLVRAARGRGARIGGPGRAPVAPSSPG